MRSSTWTVWYTEISCASGWGRFVYIQSRATSVKFPTWTWVHMECSRWQTADRTWWNRAELTRTLKEKHLCHWVAMETCGFIRMWHFIFMFLMFIIIGCIHKDMTSNMKLTFRYSLKLFLRMFCCKLDLIWTVQGFSKPMCCCAIDFLHVHHKDLWFFAFFNYETWRLWYLVKGKVFAWG